MYLKFKTTFIIGEYIIKTLLGISLVLLIFYVTNNIKIGNIVISFLAEISYEIYLVHRMIIALISKIPELNSWQFIYIVIFVTIISAYILNLIDKKIKYKLRGEKNVRKET